MISQRLFILASIFSFAFSIQTSFSKTIAVKLSANIDKNSFATRSKSGGNVVNDVFPGAEAHTSLGRWLFLDDSQTDISSLVSNGTIICVDTLPARRLQVLPEIHRPGFTNGTGNRTESVGDTEPYRYMQWQLDRIYANQAWSVTSGSSDVIVAVVDVGTDITHPDLINQIAINQAERLGQTGVDDDHNGFIDDIHGWNFVDNNDDPTPPTTTESHGTHVAGIILAAQNGQFGEGVAPHVKLLAIRTGAGESISYGYDGIYYAVLRGAKIINCSWGGTFISSAEADVVEYAISQGVSVFCAAGNSTPASPIDSMLYPAALPGVISVGASTREDFPAYFSNRNITVSVWAPGMDIPSIFPRSGFAVISGTSMASPCAAGVGALIKSVLPDATPQQVRTILISTGDQMVDVINHPAMRVNAYRAVTEAMRQQGTTDAMWSGTEQPFGTMHLTIPIQLDQPSTEPLILMGTQMNGATWTTASTAMTSSQNGTLWNGTLSAILPSGTFRGSTIIAGWRVTGNGYTRYYGSSTHRIAPPEATIEDSQMRLTFSGIGAIGLYDPYTSLPVGVSLQSPPNTPGVIFHGSFLLSYGSNAVEDNIFGDDNNTGFDWQVPLNQPVTVTGTPPQQIQTTATLVPSHSTLPISVDWSAQMVSQTATVPAVDITGRIHNNTVSTLNNIIAGWIIDFDVGNPGNDVGYTDTTARLLTIGDASQASRYGVFVNHGSLSVARLILASTINSAQWIDQQKYLDLIWTGSDGQQNSANDYAMLFATPSISIPGNGYYDFGFRIYYAPTQQQAVQLAAQWRGSSSLHEGTSRTQPSITVKTSGSTINISSTSGMQKLNLYNILGQLVRTQNMNGQQTSTLSLIGLPHGAYFVSAIAESGPLPVRKVIYLQ